MVVADRDAFLAGRYIASLATENPDGSSYLTAVWYLFEDGVFYFPTGRATRKARNVAARRRAAVMVDSRDGVLRGVAASGAAELVTGEAALRMNAHIHRRYLTEQGLEDPRLGGPITASDDVTIRLEPERWHAWDMSEFFGDLFASHDFAYALDG